MAKRQIKNTIGDRIRTIREAADISGPQLAAAAGVSKSTISKYESDQQTPGADRLVAIANVLGVPVSALLPSDRIVWNSPDMTSIKEIDTISKIGMLTNQTISFDKLNWQFRNREELNSYIARFNKLGQTFREWRESIGRNLSRAGTLGDFVIWRGSQLCRYLLIDDFCESYINTIMEAESIGYLVIADNVFDESLEFVNTELRGMLWQRISVLAPDCIVVTYEDLRVDYGWDLKLAARLRQVGMAHVESFAHDHKDVSSMIHSVNTSTLEFAKILFEKAASRM